MKGRGVGRWLWYLVPILLVLAGLLGPALFANGTHASQQITSQSVSATGSTSRTAKLPETTVDSPHSLQVPTSTATQSITATQGIEATQAATPPRATTATTGTTATKPITVAPARPSVGLVVSVAVVGKNGALLYGPSTVTLPPKSEWGITAMGALVAAGVPYAMSTTYSNFVESIAGEQNRGISGWMYAVDGRVGPVAANAEPVKAGDQVIWWYAQSPSSLPPNWADLSAHN